jgi:hypothetical protein
MDVFLQTDRLRLRRFTTADVDNLVALDGDAEVMRYLTKGSSAGSRCSPRKTAAPRNWTSATAFARPPGAADTEHGEVEHELLREDWLRQAARLPDAHKTGRDPAEPAGVPWAARVPGC